MNQIRCYDRFAPHKRWALTSLALLGGVALLGWSLPAEAAPPVEQLPRVVVVGKSLATQQAEARQRLLLTQAQAQAEGPVPVTTIQRLPRVVIVGQRQPLAIEPVAPRATVAAAF
ncbi:MAG: hypothetical protein ABW005_03310 [Burkholderiaceae bacterium]